MKNNIILEDLQRIAEAKLPWELFANKTILVTGANGFLPAYMVKTLLYLNDTQQLNSKIIGLVRSRERACQSFSEYLSRNDFELRVQDISEPFSFAKDLHFIIHAASQASPKYYGVDPVGTLSANVMGTRYLLENARANSIESFLYFSSGEVYGEVNENDVPTHESAYGFLDPLNVRSCYAEGKRMGENMCISYGHQYGLSVKIVRPFHIYGPGVRLDDGRVFSDFIADLVNKRDLTMLGTGSAERAFCYLADATIGFFTVLLKGQSLQAYNIGNPFCFLSIKELAERLTRAFSHQNTKLVMKARDQNEGYIESKISKNCPDITKARNLGWIPSTTIEEGFARTVQSFQLS